MVESVCEAEVEEDKVADAAEEMFVGEELGEGFECEEGAEQLEEAEDCNETASKRRRRVFHIV